MKWVAIDMKGQKFGRLTVLERAGTNGQKLATWIAQCDCGTVGIYAGRSLRDGNTRSCGCLHREGLIERAKLRPKVPRKPLPKEYNIWQGIKYRCLSPQCEAYKNYGGRGITIHESWRHNFKQFLADVGPRPDEMTLDRIDNNGNYEPGNVRWASRKVQCRNKRNNRGVIRGDGIKFRTVSEAAEAVGGQYSGIYAACVGRQRTAFGHTWKFYEGSNE